MGCGPWGHRESDTTEVTEHKGNWIVGFPLEILVTVHAVNLIYQFWVHTQLVRRMGVLDYILVTPSNHRVHHGQNEPYIDKNYGGMFILWDRLFGTFADERADEPVVFGVRKPLVNWNPFWANIQVYDYLLFDAIRTDRWADKIGIWFRRTGWRPADVASRYPKRASSLSTFRKYDPAIAAAVRIYVVAQFIVAIGIALWLSLRLSSIRTNTVCNLTAVAACCLKIQRLVASTNTTRRIHITARLNYISVKSAWNVLGPARRPLRSGPLRSYCHS